MSELVHVARPLALATLPDRIAYAEKLAMSGLLPDSYKKQPANVFYAIEFGAMLGLGPMAAITGIHVIKGKPTASAGLIGALVRRAGHRLRTGYDPERGIGWAEITRSDDPSYTFRAEWDTARAVKAGLCTVGKDGQPYARDEKNRPTSWEKYPPNMKKHRAVTEVARDACEEALFGLHYTPEELGAEVDEEGEVIRVPSERVETFKDVPDVADSVASGFRDQALAATTRAQLSALWTEAKAAGLSGAERVRNAAGNEVPLSDLITELGLGMSTQDAASSDAPVDAEVVDTPASEPKAEAPSAVTTPVDDAQTTADARPASRGLLSRIAVLLGELGVEDRGVKLMVCNVLANRADDSPLLTSNDLTSGEAKTVISELEESGAREMVDAIIAAGKANT